MDDPDESFDGRAIAYGRPAELANDHKKTRHTISCGGAPVVRPAFD